MLELELVIEQLIACMFMLRFGNLQQPGVAVELELDC